MRYDIVCLGEPLLELNMRSREDAGGRVYHEAHGGDTANVAVAAARQGARTAMLTGLGDDIAGRSFLALWAAEGVDASAVRIDARRATGLYFVTHDADGHHFSYMRRGSAASRYRLDEAARAVIAESQFLFASGISLAIAEDAADTVFEAMALAREAGRSVAFDTNYRPKLWPPRRAAALIGEAMRGADVVFPGIEHMRLLLGLSEPDPVIDHCLGLGAKRVVLKMGAAGAILADAESRTAVPAFPCRPVDATGAGDTFCGSFLAEFAATGDALAATRYAACAAALATTGYGAVPPIPYRSVVEEALARL